MRTAILRGYTHRRLFSLLAKYARCAGRQRLSVRVLLLAWLLFMAWAGPNLRAATPQGSGPDAVQTEIDLDKNQDRTNHGGESPAAASQPKTTDNDPVGTSRGQMLYENHCTSCHSSQAHVRVNAKAVDIVSLRGWVARWQIELKLPWSIQEQNDVVTYLNQRFYHFEQTK